MEYVRDYLQTAMDENVLWEVMGWDIKHGPTEEEIAAFELLFPGLL